MTQIIAHRGLCQKQPENTFQAVTDAYYCDDIDGVEIDVWFTKDGVPVLQHDQNIFVNTNSSGNITEKSYVELENVSFGYHKFESIRLIKENFVEINRQDSRKNLIDIKDLFSKKGAIMTLSEALELLPEDKTLYVDIQGPIKNYNQANLDCLVNLFKEYSHKDIKAHGFDDSILRYIKTTIPDMEVGIGLRSDLSVLKNNIYDYVCFDMKYLNDKNIGDLKEFIVNYPNVQSIMYKLDVKKELKDYERLASLYPDDNKPSFMTNFTESARNLTAHLPQFQKSNEKKL